MLLPAGGCYINAQLYAVTHARLRRVMKMSSSRLLLIGSQAGPSFTCNASTGSSQCGMQQAAAGCRANPSQRPHQLRVQRFRPARLPQPHAHLIAPLGPGGTAESWGSREQERSMDMAGRLHSVHAVVAAAIPSACLWRCCAHDLCKWCTGGSLALPSQWCHGAQQQPPPPDAAPAPAAAPLAAPAPAAPPCPGAPGCGACTPSLMPLLSLRTSYTPFCMFS